eukprot:2183789-Pyramimonas_sp.AAC.1
MALRKNRNEWYRPSSKLYPEHPLIATSARAFPSGSSPRLPLSGLDSTGPLRRVAVLSSEKR